ncbi:ATP phosphoribosyltransferase regulatory subunit [Chloroflexota bacterium]
MNIQRCRGTYDLSHDEMRKFRLIEKTFRDCCLKWGYDEVRTPILEYLHLFTSTGTLTPKMLGKVYSFLDWDGWGGERVVLRPDGTIPVVRLYIDSMEEKRLAKLFYIANTFVFEETGEKPRERWQCGVELIGAGSAIADVELMSLAIDVLKRLKIEDIEIRLSHAGLLRALLQEFMISPREQTNVFDQMLEGNIEALARLKPEKPELGEVISLILDVKGQAPGFLKNIKALFIKSLPKLESPLNNFISIIDHIETLGFTYRIDITSEKDFEYYTGIIFQLFVDNEKIGGGGRYDDLIPLIGGKDVHSSGFALYLTNLISKARPEPVPQRILIKMIPEKCKESFALVSYLHEAGYVAELYHEGQELTDFEWTIDIRSQTPLCIMIDQARQRKFEIQNAEEILMILGGKSADKGSIT